MITDAEGNLLEADVEALVNTVNTVGVMGKGIALQFKRAFPDMFDDYSAAVKRGEVELGRMHVWHNEQLAGPRLIINFPTKQHWRGGSRLQDIEAGLDDLVAVMRKHDIRSIAIPPLGCGHGGLEWADVAPLIREKLGAAPDVDVRVYAPAGAPAAAEMPVTGPPPGMTPGRASLIEMLRRYQERSVEGASQVELQKLMYFLQVAGQPLRLNFAEHFYGPYADNLRHVLKELEGHYVIGFGDGSKSIAFAEPLRVLPGAVEAARAEIQNHAEIRERIDRVMDLVEGFESAYSLELLATVHAVITAHRDASGNPQMAAKWVHEWSPRKERMFSEEHITTAWQALRDRGWLRDQIPSGA